MANKNRHRFVVEMDIPLYSAIKALSHRERTTVSALIRQSMVNVLRARKIPVADAPEPNSLDEIAMKLDFDSGEI